MSKNIITTLQVLGIAIAAALLLWFFLSFWIGFFGGTANAHADGYCTTDYYSNTTYTICTWTDSTGYSHRTVETCYDNSPSCSIKGG